MTNKFFAIASLFIICSFRDIEIRNFPNKNINEKIKYYSNILLDKPYISQPLGEGNRAPLYRFDGFDCLTYIETVLSLSKANNLKEFKMNMNNIRYKSGNVSFLDRNHFFSLDWQNNNTHLVENITKEIGLQKINLIHKKIDKKSWFLKNYNLNTDNKVKEIAIEYIPIKHILDVVKLTPDISIFALVRNKLEVEEKIGSELAVYHTGFLLRKNGTIFLRHASSKYKKIIDEKLSEYIKRYNDNSDGFMIFKIL